MERNGIAVIIILWYNSDSFWYVQIYPYDLQSRLNRRNFLCFKIAGIEVKEPFIRNNRLGKRYYNEINRK